MNKSIQCEVVMSLEHLGESKSGQRSPRALVDSKHSHSGGKEVNFLVLGKHGVGKTGK